MQRYFSSQVSNALPLIKSREGLVLKVYKDSLGKLTAGYGHLIKPGEEAQVVDLALSDKWLKEDYQGALSAAQNQAAQLPLWTPELEAVLVSVNYQLGVKWFTKFPKTWKLMLDGNYEAAASEVENSLWHKQTPVRVRDLQRVLWRASLLSELLALE